MSANFCPFEQRVEIRWRAPHAMNSARVESVLAASGMHILEITTLGDRNAYLLAESACFVSPGQFVLLTCGEGKAMCGIETLLAQCGCENISALIFEERFPVRRPAVGNGAEMIGTAPILESLGDGYELELPTFPARWIVFGEDGVDLQGTELLELLFVGPMPELAATLAAQLKLFFTAHPSAFVFSEHAFEPEGYSCNFLFADGYVTLHSTPLEYLSVECSGTARFCTELQSVLHTGLESSAPHFERYELLWSRLFQSAAANQIPVRTRSLDARVSGS